MALVKHRNPGRYHAPKNEQDKARAGISVEGQTRRLTARRSLPIFPYKRIARAG
jgi:hypothetical protein